MYKKTLALIYDYDGTLAPGNMQDRRFVPEVNMGISEFWDLVNNTTIKNEMDPTLSYMYIMLEVAKKANIPIKREDLIEKGHETEFFDGVEHWFDRITKYGNNESINVDHYVVSSGNSEIIEGSVIAQKFKKIYASKFMYNDEGIAIWPALALNFTTKTQYLFRINKNAHDISDRSAINQYVPIMERAVPFENMIYIGDGETDVPCFRLIKDLGGLSIAVYDVGRKHEAEKFLNEGRVNAIAPADYRDGKILDKVVKSYINIISA